MVPIPDCLLRSGGGCRENKGACYKSQWHAALQTTWTHISAGGTHASVIWKALPSHQTPSGSNVQPVLRTTGLDHFHDDASLTDTVKKFQMFGRYLNLKVNATEDSHLLCSITMSPFGQIADTVLAG